MAYSGLRNWSGLGNWLIWTGPQGDGVRGWRGRHGASSPFDPGPSRGSARVERATFTKTTSKCRPRAAHRGRTTISLAETTAAVGPGHTRARVTGSRAKPKLTVAVGCAWRASLSLLEPSSALAQCSRHR